MKSILKSIAFVASCIIATSANAGAIYEYSKGSGNFGERKSNFSASYDGIYTSYNSNTQELVWEVDNGRDNNGNLLDGFWLVINGGGNPKSADVNELAIFYADFNSDSLWAYAYNGANNSNSWNAPGILIGDYSDSLVDDGTTRGFSLNASTINSFTDSSINPSDWSGAQFGEKVGIWFHPVWGLTSSTNNNGELTAFSYNNQAWFDTSALNTTVTEVPEPGTLALLALGIIGLGAARRRQA